MKSKIYNSQDEWVLSKYFEAHPDKKEYYEAHIMTMELIIDAYRWYVACVAPYLDNQ